MVELLDYSCDMTLCVAGGRRNARVCAAVAVVKFDLKFTDVCI